MGRPESCVVMCPTDTWVGKHRKHSGGRGNAGGLCHHRANFDKYHPGYFGKVGMRNFHVHSNKLISYCPSINLDKLWTLVSEHHKEKAAASKSKKVPVIDCNRAGFFKVLGRESCPSSQSSSKLGCSREAQRRRSRKPEVPASSQLKLKIKPNFCILPVKPPENT